MSTKLDDVVRDIISKGGSPAQAGTPDQLTNQVNQQQPEAQQPPAGEPQAEAPQNVATNQEPVQATGDPDADELAKLRTEQPAPAKEGGDDAEGGSAGEPAAADPEAGADAGAPAGGTDDAGAGGDAAAGSDDAGNAAGAPAAEGGDAADAGGDAGGTPPADDEDADDGFDVEPDDGDVGIETDDVDDEPVEADLPPEDDDVDDEPDAGSQDGEGADQGGSEEQKPEGESSEGGTEGTQESDQSDPGTGGEASQDDQGGGVEDGFQEIPADDAQPGAGSDDGSPGGGDDSADGQPEGDEEPDAADDTETTRQEAASAADAEQAEDPTEKASLIIREAREISDRLGEMAQSIVDRHNLNGEDQGQLPGGTVQASEVQGDAEGEQEAQLDSVATESMRIHSFARQMLLAEARGRLGFSVESDASSGTVYHQANVRVLEDAISSLVNLSQNSVQSRLHMESKLDALANRIANLDMNQEITIDSLVINDLHIQGAISLDTLLFAPTYQKVVNELREWLRTMLGVYLKNAQGGSRTIVMPFTSGVLVDNAKLAQELRESHQVSSDSVSRVMPGNRVLAYLKQGEIARVMKVVRLKEGAQPPKQFTLSKTSIGSVKQALTEAQLVAKVLQDSVRNVAALANASKSILSWVHEASDDELITLNLPDVLPLAYGPAISIHSNLNGYAWALIGLLEAIVAQAAPKAPAETAGA